MAKGAYRRGDVPTVAGVIYKGGADVYLAEGVVHVGIRTVGAADDGQLAGQRVRPAQTVDLPAVRAAEDGQDYPVPLLRLCGQVVLQEKNGLAGAPAHDHTGNAFLFRVVHGCLLLHYPACAADVLGRNVIISGKAINRINSSIASPR